MRRETYQVQRMKSSFAVSWVTCSHEFIHSCLWLFPAAFVWFQRYANNLSAFWAFSSEYSSLKCWAEFCYTVLMYWFCFCSSSALLCNCQSFCEGLAKRCDLLFHLLKYMFLTVILKCCTPLIPISPSFPRVWVKPVVLVKVFTLSCSIYSSISNVYLNTCSCYVVFFFLCSYLCTHEKEADEDGYSIYDLCESK